MIFSDSVNKGYTIKNLLLLPVKAMSPYWYLYVLIFYYFVFYQIMKKNNQDEKHLSICFVISAMGTLFIRYISFAELFRIGSFITYISFFSLGIYISKVKGGTLLSETSYIITFILTVISLMLSIICRINLLEVPIIGTIAAAVITIFTINMFEKISVLSNAKILTLCGKYSLEIYVTHCFITAANRIILIKLGITMFGVNVLVNFIMATFIPVLCAYILKKIKFHEYIFRPFTAIEKRKSQIQCKG